MSEKQPVDPGHDLSAWNKVLQCGLLGMLAVLVFVFTLSHCTFWVYGDSADYISFAQNFRHGYFEQNRETLKRRAEHPEAFDQARSENRFIEMNTEGGFHYLLHLARKIHVNHPYRLNGLLMGLNLLCTAAILLLTRSGRGPPVLAPALFLLAIALTASTAEHPQAQHHIASLCQPFRDTPALLFSQLSVIFALLCGRSRSRRRYLYAALAGVLLGLACWCRVTAILFALINLPLILLPGWKEIRWKKHIFALGITGVFGLVGLAPLFAQNYLEGRSVLTTGESDTMLETRAGPDGASTYKAMSLANFKRTLLGDPNSSRPGSLVYVRDMLPIWLWIFAGAGLVYGLRYQRERTLIFAGIALLYFLFYTCYIRSIARYLFGAVYFVLPLCLPWLGDLFGRLGKRFEPRMQARIGTLASLVATLAVVGVLAPQIGGFDAFGKESREMSAFQSWLQKNIQPAQSLIYCPNPALKAVCENYAHDDTIIKWRWHGHMRNQSVKNYDVTRPEDVSVYLLLPADESGAPVTSWWMEDGLNEFDLERFDESCRFSGSPAKRKNVVGYKLLSQQTRERTIVVETPTTNAPAFLKFQAYELPGSARRLSVTLLSEDGTISQVATLQAGPNMIPLSDPALAQPNGIVQLRAATALPNIDQAIIEPHPQLTVSFIRYRDIPNAGNTIDGMSFHPRGYPIWLRDWHHLEPTFETYPEFRLAERNRIKLPPFSGSYALRIYYSIRTRISDTEPSEQQLIKDLQGFSYSLNERNVPVGRYVIGEHHDRHHYRYLDLIDEITLPFEPADSDSDLLFHRGTSSTPFDLLVHKIDFAVSPLDPRLAIPAGETVRLKWGADARGWVFGFKPGFEPLPGRYLPPVPLP